MHTRKTKDTDNRQRAKTCLTANITCWFSLFSSASRMLLKQQTHLASSEFLLFNTFVSVANTWVATNQIVFGLSAGVGGGRELVRPVFSTACGLVSNRSELVEESRYRGQPRQRVKVTPKKLFFHEEVLQRVRGVCWGTEQHLNNKRYGCLEKVNLFRDTKKEEEKKKSNRNAAKMCHK